MGKIKQMPESLSNQIAAGEVVERPASVVKELVENAIDAGSTQILIELEEAGIQSISVSDNGMGMDAEDVRLSITPHATSKVYELQDLFQIQSLGFRGEALASIASVSKMTIVSRTADNTGKEGHFLLVEGSKILKEGVKASNQGTLIKVENLFYNTPARLKHLASLKTELRHSLHFVQEISLAYPHIRFTLMSDGNKIFSTYGRGDLKQAIASIYQPTLARQLIKIQGQDDDFKIEGYISPPQLTRTSRSHLHWLINGRVIQSYVLSQVLLRAYGRQLMIGRYPIGIISIQLDPQLVDVNVHPTKQTVRLSKEEELTTLLTEVIQRALNQVNPIPRMEVENLSLDSIKGTGHSSHLKSDYLNQEATFKKARVNQEMKESHLFELDSDYDFNEEDHIQGKGFEAVANKQTVEERPGAIFDTQSADVEEKKQASDNASKARPIQTRLGEQDGIENVSEQDASNHVEFANLRYVGQIHGTYLIAESEQGFYLIDQHAAQERIRYEAFMKDEEQEITLQQVLMPFIFEFSPAEMVSVEALSDSLKKLGFYLEQMGPTTYQMEAYPYWLEAEEVDKVVHDLLVILEATPHISISQLKEKALIMKACRGAIKANHHLSDQEARTLIQDLAYLDDPYHCPHGRPVLVEFNQKTLEKLFKRIQDSHQAGNQII